MPACSFAPNLESLWRSELDNNNQLQHSQLSKYVAQRHKGAVIVKQISLSAMNLTEFGSKFNPESGHAQTNIHPRLWRLDDADNQNRYDFSFNKMPTVLSNSDSKFDIGAMHVQERWGQGLLKTCLVCLPGLLAQMVISVTVIMMMMVRKLMTTTVRIVVIVSFVISMITAVITVYWIYHYHYYF